MRRETEKKQERGLKQDGVTSKQKSEGPQAPLAQPMEPSRPKLTFTINLLKA